MNGAGSFLAKVSMLSAIDVCKVPLEMGLEDCEFVGHVRVQVE